MPKFGKRGKKSLAAISKFVGRNKADISKVDGISLEEEAASGPSLWCIVGADGAVATAAASDLNDWTAYVSANMGTKDYNSIAFGKDGGGSSLWVAVDSNGNREIRYTSDPTNTSGWSDANVAANMIGIAWGNNVWVAVGGSGKVYRSTDGATWSAVNMSGVSGWNGSTTIYEVVSDGAGNWMCAQDMDVFHSTDDASTWTRVADFTDTGTDGGALSGYKAYTMAYTSDRWSVFMRKAGNSRVFTAAAASTSTWTRSTPTNTNQAIVSQAARRMAGGAGTVIIVASNDTSRSTDGGQTWTKNVNDLPRTDARDIATDGQGNWIVVHDSGRVSLSSDDGVTWSEQTGDQYNGNTNLRFPSGGTNIENLDAVCADVLLPV